MSTLSILPYFPFNRVRIIKQAVFADTEISQITAVPDQRYSPVCPYVVTGHNVFTVMKTVHSRSEPWFNSSMDKLFVSQDRLYSMQSNSS